jgi:GH24 family phage-related lysozyme (muramidase)/uncharacterized protein (DUF2345 family)
MANLGKFSTQLPKAYNMDPEGKRSTWDKIYAGFVRDTQDGSRLGRIKVWIPELCGPDTEDTWIIVDYGSPFAGATPAADLGANPGGGQKSYGMWMIPKDKDNQVLVVFVNGDPNRGVWIACLPHVDAHRMTPSMPGNSIPPEEANKNVAAPPSEAPAQTMPAVGPATPATPSAAGGDSQLGPTQQRSGTDQIPALGNATRSSHNSYDVFGINTPGGNRFIMSDAEGETQIRLGTRNNIQLVLHNETGIATLMTGDGKSRIELHRDGAIYIYGQQNINIRSKQDVNIHADKNVNIQAGNLVQIKSDAAMKIQSGDRMNFYSLANIHMTSMGEHHRYSNGHIFDTSSQKINRLANFGIRDTTNSGNIDVFSWGSIVLNSANDFDIKTVSKLSLQSTLGTMHLKTHDVLNIWGQNDVNIKSTTKVNIQSTEDLNIKSGANLNLDAASSGNIRSSKPLNLQSLNGNLNIKGGTTVVIGPTSIINAGTVPSAGAAGAADNAQDSVPIAEQALPAVIADTPTTYNRVENSPDSSGTGGSGGPGGAGGGGSQSVISTITSETPGPEPDTTRFMNSPGYSGTNTVEIAEDVAEGINTGQILKNQSTPLQTLGFVGSGATIGEGGGATNDKGFNPLIYEAIQAIQTTYPRARLSSGVRTSDGASQHSLGNAVDFVLDGLSTIERSSLMQEIATGITSGNGPYRFVRGVGTYDTTGRILHLDCRPRNSAGVVNAMDAWGPNYSISSISSTPSWFQQALQASGGSIGLRPANPRSQTPGKPGEPAPTNSEPLRWIGTGYEANGAPRYRTEPVTNWTFKPANQYSISDIGLTDIKNFEGLRGPRPDNLTGKQFENVCGGKSMIGHGHVLTESEITNGKVSIEGTDVSIKDVLSAENALKLLKQDIKSAEGWVKSACGDVPLTQQQFDALVDLAWNIGEQKFTNSKLVKFVKEKNYNNATTEFIKWCQACGVIRADLQSRRKANALRWCGIMRPETPVPVSSIAADGDISPVTGSGSAAEAMAWFQSAQGGNYSKAQAAGIVGNLIQESGLRPGISEKGINPGNVKAGAGLAQWTSYGGRKERVAQYLNVRDVREASFQQQLSAVTWELSTSERGADRALRATNDVAQATTVFCNLYERPLASAANIPGRIANANKLLSQ